MSDNPTTADTEPTEPPTEPTPEKPRSVLRDRFLYGTLLLGGVLGLLGLDQRFESSLGFFSLVLLFALVSWWELTRMLDVQWVWARLCGTGVIAAALFEEWWTDLHSAELGTLHLDLAQGAPFVFLVLLLLGAFRGPMQSERASELSRALLGFVYLVLPLAFLIRLRLSFGEAWIVYTVLLVKGNDIGAFLVGRSFGRTPLTRISPKKTVEGMLGGLSLGIVVSFGFYFMTDLFADSGSDGMPTWLFPVLIGLAAGLAGQLGDLAESYFKRSFGVKDSGALVPAFGGTLDMLDSVLFGAPVVYAFAAWW